MNTRAVGGERGYASNVCITTTRRAIVRMLSEHTYERHNSKFLAAGLSAEGWAP